MTKDEIKTAILAGETIVDSYGYQRGFSIDYHVSHIDYHVSHIDQWSARIKPKPIIINGIEIPEPLRYKPSYNDIFYVVSSDGIYKVRNTLDNYNVEFKNGALHATKKAAQAHYDAIWAPTRLKKFATPLTK